MRISDWSSDVCSSDLARARPLQARRPGAGDPQGGQGRPRPRTGAGSRTAGRGVNRPAADRGGAAVRGGLVLALGMTAALLSPPARADGDRARLATLDRNEWSAAMADRYAAGREPQVDTRAWSFSRPHSRGVIFPASPVRT